MAKLISFFTALLMFILPSLNLPEANVDSSKFNTEYTNVFVHGFAGWGEYDATNKALPYWGNTSGDLMKYLSAGALTATPQAFRQRRAHGTGHVTFTPSSQAHEPTTARLTARPAATRDTARATFCAR